MFLVNISVLFITSRAPGCECKKFPYMVSSLNCAIEDKVFEIFFPVTDLSDLLVLKINMCKLMFSLDQFPILRVMKMSWI